MLHFYLLIIVQILVESLPISSSGHLILLHRALQKISAYMPSADDEAMSIINNEAVVHFLHGPTIIILLIFFAHQIVWAFEYRTRYWALMARIAALIVCADVVTVAWYIVLKSLGTEWFSMTLGFVVTACALLSLSLSSNVYRRFSFSSAIIIGFVQGIALLPGISRFAVTYVAGRWLSLSPRRAIEFSLLIELPLITAAFCKSVYVLHQSGMLAQLLNLPVLLIMLGAGVVSAGILYIVVMMAEKKQWWLFGWYVSLLVLGIQIIK